MNPTTDPMSDVVVACPHCGQRCEVLTWILGRPVKCPRCRQRFEAIAEQPKPPPKWTTCRSQRVNLGPPRFDDVRARPRQTQPRGTQAQTPPKPSKPKRAMIGTPENPFYKPPTPRCRKCGYVGDPVRESKPIENQLAWVVAAGFTAPEIAAAPLCFRDWFDACGRCGERLE